MESLGEWATDGQPIVEKFVQKGTLINTDEYSIYSRLPEREYEHKSMCHGIEEYTRDEDGDGPLKHYSVKFSSSQWKEFGCCYGIGCVLIAALSKRLVVLFVFGLASVDSTRAEKSICILTNISSLIVSHFGAINSCSGLPSGMTILQWFYSF